MTESYCIKYLKYDFLFTFSYFIFFSKFMKRVLKQFFTISTAICSTLEIGLNKCSILLQRRVTSNCIQFHHKARIIICHSLEWNCHIKIYCIVLSVQTQAFKFLEHVILYFRKIPSDLKRYLKTIELQFNWRETYLRDPQKTVFGMRKLSS